MGGFVASEFNTFLGNKLGFLGANRPKASSFARLLLQVPQSVLFRLHPWWTHPPMQVTCMFVKQIFLGRGESAWNLCWLIGAYSGTAV
jgi:hypothetical protein